MDIEALRVAVIGCGYHGTAVAQAAVRSDQFQLVACVDPDEPAAQSVAALASGAGIYASVADLLAVADVDAVLIATPHDVLAPIALAAIRAGKHVMVEKPMALNEEQAKEIEFAAASGGMTCMVGYSFRFGMARHVSELLVQGAIGDCRAITGAIGTGAMDDDWVARPECGGGPMLYVGCHMIDLALWFMGEEPSEVSATVRYRQQGGVDDTTSMTLEFKDRRLAQFLVTQAAPGFFYDLRIVGSDGFIALRGRNFVQFELEVQSETLEAFREPTIIRPGMQRDHITMMLMPELAEFAAAIAAGRPPAITAIDGRRVLRVIDAVHRSSQEQRPVQLAPMLNAY